MTKQCIKNKIIYRCKCYRLECKVQYIGESAKTFRERLEEHLRALSPIHDHDSISGHLTKLNNFSTVGREYHFITSTTNKAMFIRVNDPSLNQTNCPTYGMRSYVTSLAYTSNRFFPQPIQVPCARSITSAHQQCRGPHTVSTSSTFSRYGSCNITNWCPHLSTMYPLFAYHKAMYGKY